MSSIPFMGSPDRARTTNSAACCFLPAPSSSGTTVSRAVEALVQHGARRILAAAGHGVFSGRAEQLLAHPALVKILVTDSVPPFRLGEGAARDKLEIVSVASLVAHVTKRMYEGGSASELLAENPLVKDPGPAQSTRQS